MIISQPGLNKFIMLPLAFWCLCSAFLSFFMFDFLLFLLYGINELNLEERIDSELWLAGKIGVEELEDEDELLYLIFHSFCVLDLFVLIIGKFL